MSNKICGIYSITCSENNKIYYGQSINFDKRRKSHIRDLRKNRHGNDYLQRSFNKYGEGSFSFNIVEEVKDSTLLNEVEQKWIDSKPWDELFNMNPIADKPPVHYGESNPSKRPEVRIKISEALKGKPKSDEAKKSYSDFRRTWTDKEAEILFNDWRNTPNYRGKMKDFCLKYSMFRSRIRRILNYHSIKVYDKPFKTYKRSWDLEEAEIIYKDWTSKDSYIGKYPEFVKKYGYSRKVISTMIKFCEKAETKI